VPGGWIFTSFQLTAKDPQQKYHLSVHFFLDKYKIWEYIPKKKMILLSSPIMNVSEVYER